MMRGIGGFPKQEGHYSIVYDHTGKIVDSSASTTQILGYPRAELLGMHRSDLRSDLTQSEYEALRVVTLAGIGSPAFDTAHRKKNGEMLPVKLRVKLLAAEGNRYVLVTAKVLGTNPRSVVRDDRVRYEFSLNTKDEFLYVSNPLASRLDRRWITLIGRSVDEVVRPADGGRGQKMFKKLLASEGFFQLKDAEMICRDTASLVLDLSFHPHEDDYEGFGGYDVAGTVSAV